ncbi:MAG: ATP-binding protein [Bacteroidales bacterium]|jgi:MinD superfamily P-loop ATPase|nr:ATP-binding protein [Bacteroidales bacterium]
MRVAIASGKGGTGKTFVATNLFNVLSQRGDKVTLVDCDAEAPDDLIFIKAGKISESEVTHLVPVISKDACTFCGHCSSWCNYNAIFYVPSSRVIEVIENLCHGCGACSFACNSGAITEKPVVLGSVSAFVTSNGSSFIEARMRVNEMSPVRVIKAAVKEAGEEGVIILDAPPGTSCPFVQTVDRADYVVLVTEPTPFGLSDLRQSVETLRGMDRKCGVIINRADIGNNNVRNYLDEEKIPLLAEINYDKVIARTYSEGGLVTDENPAMVKLFADLAEKIVNHD